MIDQTTLSKLLFNIDKIEKLANIHGFKNISIFKPLFFTDSNKLNFVAAPHFDGIISFFRLTDIESELSIILNCKTLFFPEDKINNRFKKYINKNKILLTQDNKEKIARFFYSILEIKEIKLNDHQPGEYLDESIVFQTGLADTIRPDKFQGT